jgi:outer membrane protein assembly factor BamB
MSSAADRSPHSWRLYALDRASGEVVWERTAHQGVPATPRHPKNSYASQTPATDGEHVVAFFGSEGLYCYDAAGELVWRRDLGTIDAGFFFDPGYSWGTASSPVLWRDLVIVQVDRQADSFIAAFDLASGKERWRTPRDELPSWATPTVWESSEGAVLLTNGIRGMRGYDPATGEGLWHLATGNSMISGATPVADREVAVIGNGYRPLTPIYAVRAGARGDISLAEGETANRGVAWSTKSGGPYYVTPLIYEDFLYVLSNDGVLTAYLTLTGERVYRERVGEKAVGFSASQVAADGRLYLASEDGDVYVVRAGHDYRLLGVNPVGELMMATPAVAGGMIVLRTRDRVIAIGKPGAGDGPGTGETVAAGEASGRRAGASGSSPSGGR